MLELSNACPNIWGNEPNKLGPTWALGGGKGIDGLCWRGFGEWVKSKVTVGKGAEAEIVATLDEQGSMVLAAKKFGFIRPSPLGIEPDRSMVAADEVVSAIATAAGGNGWL